MGRPLKWVSELVARVCAENQRAFQLSCRQQDRARRPRRKPCRSLGSLQPQFVKLRGKVYGPYWYRFYREGGKLRKVYVPAADLERVRAECEADALRRKLATVEREQSRAVKSRRRA